MIADSLPRGVKSCPIERQENQDGVKTNKECRGDSVLFRFFVVVIYFREKRLHIS